MVPFAHLVVDRPGFLVTSTETANTLLGTVRDTETSLDGNFGAARFFALLSGGSMSAAHASLFDLLVASSWMPTFLALGTVRNAEATLNHSIYTFFNLALSTFAFFHSVVSGTF